MKYSPLRLAFLSGIFLACFVSDAFSQGPHSQCWDFEENCVNPANAFHSGCIANAQSASGTPDTYSDYFGIGAASGSKYAHMYAKYCFIEPSNPNRYHTEGVILKHNFIAGVPVTISFAIRSRSGLQPSETKVVLVNSMPNYGGSGGGSGCLNTLDLLPNIPANSETIATYSSGDISGTAWETKTITWTPQSNFSQIWFRPKAISEVINGDLSQDLFLDNVCIEEHCPPPPTISYCLYPGTDQIVVNINASLVKPKEWTLFTAPDCAPFFGSKVEIQWLPGFTSFVLPQNSGCYMLASNSISAPWWCPSQQFPFFINTDQDMPLCTDLCTDWEMTATRYCGNEFTVTPNTAFTLPTTFTFLFEGEIMQNGMSPIFIDMGQIEVPFNGYYEMCVRVQQANCPAVEKCIEFYYDCYHFQGSGDERTEIPQENIARTSFLISNPSSGSIWMSTPVEQGTARLYSMQGALVKSFVLEGTDRLNVSELVNGQYILSIKSPDYSVSKLVFIQNQH